MKLLVLVMIFIFIGCTNSNTAIVDDSNQPSKIIQESVIQSNPEIKGATPVVTNSTGINAAKSQPEATTAQVKSNNAKSNKLSTQNLIPTPTQVFKNISSNQLYLKSISGCLIRILGEGRANQIINDNQKPTETESSIITDCSKPKKVS